MDYSATFARHFARLVSLLRHDPANVGEQKVALRALVTLSKRGPVKLTSQDSRLLANDAEVARVLTGVEDVLNQLAAHSIIDVAIGPASGAADLLGLARLVAGPATEGDRGANASKLLQAINPAAIAFVFPDPPPLAEPAPPQSLSEAPTLVVETADAAPQAVQQAAALLAGLGARDVSTIPTEVLLEGLDRAAAADVAAQMLDDLLQLAEHHVRTGKTAAVTDLLHAIVTREAGLADANLKRAYAAAVRRMAKPAILRAVAALILKQPERKQACYEVLERAGGEGAEAVIEQITQAPTVHDRATLVELFRELSEAVPALTRMLGDSRWFVVRNAADLLGELAAPAAEPDLIALLRHGDDRVRRAATNALLKLGTPQAIRSVYDAVGDESPEVRMHATAAIATRKDARTSTTLIRAIEAEDDADVQLAMIAALGKVATPDAVQKLVRMAAQDGRLFRRKAASLRVAAVQALGEARTPAALAALRELAADKDREVRETATRALAQALR